MLRAVLVDFDGTLVTQDILDVVCGIVGKEKESEKINQEFHARKRTGITPLITRINFLRGVTLTQIQHKLQEQDYLNPGVQTFFSYLKQHHLVSIIHSGNIVPILTYYQHVLGADYIVGTRPKMNGDEIVGISEEDFVERNFKVAGVKEILEKLAIHPKETIAIGDSPADRSMFAFAGKSIAINPKYGIEEFADYLIYDSLANAIPILEKLTIRE